MHELDSCKVDQNYHHMHELDDFKVGQTYHQMHELDSCKVGHHQQTNLLFRELYDAHFEIHLQQDSSIRLQEGKWLLVRNIDSGLFATRRYEAVSKFPLCKKYIAESTF